MIDDLKLKQLELRFSEKMEKVTDTNEMYDLYESFYQWLKKQKGCSDELLRVEYTILYRALRWFDALHIREKDLSKHWNKSLIKIIASAAEREKQYTANGRDLSDEAEIDRDLWVNALNKEMDFATVVYCYRILERAEVFPIPKALSILDSKQDHHKVQTVLRPRTGSDGSFIKDDGRKYWHVDAKELMTYDECTQRGLNHCLLAYADGNLKGLFVGFAEPDNSKPFGSIPTKKQSGESIKICDVVSID